MAISPPHSVASPEPYVSPTDWLVVSLTAGWDLIPPEQGGRSLCAGDLVILVVTTDPLEEIICPSGWTQNGDHAFYKMIGPAELNPLFRTRRPVRWLWQGRAYTGTDGIGSLPEPDYG